MKILDAFLCVLGVLVMKLKQNLTAKMYYVYTMWLFLGVLITTIVELQVKNEIPVNIHTENLDSNRC